MLTRIAAMEGDSLCVIQRFGIAARLGLRPSIRFFLSCLGGYKVCLAFRFRHSSNLHPMLQTLDEDLIEVLLKLV